MLLMLLSFFIYFFAFLAAPLLQAKRQCVQLGGLLAVLSTPTTWEEVAKILFKKRSLVVFIGLKSASSNLPSM